MCLNLVRPFPPSLDSTNRCTDALDFHLTGILDPLAGASSFPNLFFPTLLRPPSVTDDGPRWVESQREDWKPVLNLNAIMIGLQYLFLEPNADDPLNKGTSLLPSSLLLKIVGRVADGLLWSRGMCAGKTRRRS